MVNSTQNNGTANYDSDEDNTEEIGLGFSPLANEFRDTQMCQINFQGDELVKKEIDYNNDCDIWEKTLHDKYFVDEFVCQEPSEDERRCLEDPIECVSACLSNKRKRGLTDESLSNEFIIYAGKKFRKMVEDMEKTCEEEEMRKACEGENFSILDCDVGLMEIWSN